MSNPNGKPRIPRGDALPTKGYAVCVDTKVKSEYAVLDEAMKAGSEIRRKFPAVQVTVYDAKEGTRMAVE